MKSTWLIPVAVLMVSLGPARGAEGGGTVIQNVAIKTLAGGTPDESYVRSHLTAKKGMELEREALSRDVKVLMGTGLFSWVGVDVEKVSGGVNVIYSLRVKSRLKGDVAVTGSDYYSDAKIRDMLHLDPGDPVDDTVMAVQTQKVVDEYRKAYFSDVGVTWTIAEKEGGLAVVTVNVKEGGRAKVKAVRFVGNANVPSGDLRTCLKQPAWWNPCWWLKKRRYDPGELETARADMAALYMSRGFLDAKVSLPELQKDERGRLTVVVIIDEGKPYRFGTLSLDGVKQFPEAEVKSCLFARSGSVASTEVTRRMIQAVQDYYGSRGYVDTQVRPSLETDPARGVANLRLAVAEGSLAKIRNIRIQGNSRTRDKVIRRELLVYPGDVFDTVSVRRSERIISNLGYFSAVRSFPLKTALDDERDLVFEVEEQRTGRLMMSAGFSSIDRVMGLFEISQGNFDLFGWPYFTGGGQKLKLTTQFGSRRKLYEISFVEPWFLDRKLSLGVDLYATDVTYTDYDIERLGGAVTVGKPLTAVDRVELQYSLERERLRDIADTNAYVNLDTGDLFYFTTDTKNTKSSLTLSLIRDTRDHPFVPSSGGRATLFGSVSGGPLGFDTDLYQLGFRGSQYVPLWFRHVLALKVRCETQDRYGDTEEVPITDRLFLGGGRTLRGFKYRDVGPKVARKADVDSHLVTPHSRPVGGNSLAMATAEYTIPVVSIIRLACFFDIGNAWRDAYEFKPDSLAMSAGAGLRLDIPGFPMKLDYGWVIAKDDRLTDKEPWIFWIGPDF